MDCEMITDKDLLEEDLGNAQRRYNRILDKLEALNEEAFAYEQEILDLKARLKEVD